MDAKERGNPGITFQLGFEPKMHRHQRQRYVAIQAGQLRVWA